MEDIFIDADPEYRVSLARQIQKEGLSESLGEAFGLIDSGRSVRGGVYYEDGDDKYPVYCELDDDLIEINATFVEVPFVF